MFDRIFIKFFPIYININNYCLAFWSAPIRYAECESLSPRHDTYIQALRITIRRNTKAIIVIKKGTI